MRLPLLILFLVTGCGCGLSPCWGQTFATDVTDWSIEQQLERTGHEFKQSAFHGYDQFEFTATTDHARCRIVAPRIPAAGRPWIWRARFFGHQPALDLALLARGFHVAYCDVSNLYGAPTAVRRWNEFYELTQQWQLHPQPVLEGMSRGGLIIFNWAKQNPERVSAIYADNPVCDIRSWPRKKSEPDWKRCLAAWDLKENDVESFQGNPIDDLERITRIPVFLVLGLKDDVVPVKENGNLLKSKLEQLGGKVMVWEKPDAGHHPHGLAPPDPLWNRLISSTLPAPSSNIEMRRQKLKKASRILFLGDSITYSGGFVADFETWCRCNDLLREETLVVNMGLPSETVSGLSEEGHAGGRFPRPDLHERLERALEAYQPDLVIAGYGMNCGIYQPLDADRFARYWRGIQKLQDAADRRGISLILLTPMPYDAHDTPSPHAYSAVLSVYSQWLLHQRVKGREVIDLHFPMASLIADRRRVETGFTFQKDRVHPDAGGHREAARVLADYFSDKPTTLDTDAFRALSPSIRKRMVQLRNEWLQKTGHGRPGTPGYEPRYAR